MMTVMRGVMWRVGVSVRRELLRLGRTLLWLAWAVPVLVGGVGLVSKPVLERAMPVEVGVDEAWRSLRVMQCRRGELGGWRRLWESGRFVGGRADFGKRRGGNGVTSAGGRNVHRGCLCPRNGRLRSGKGPARLMVRRSVGHSRCVRSRGERQVDGDCVGGISIWSGAGGDANVGQSELLRLSARYGILDLDSGPDPDPLFSLALH